MRIRTATLSLVLLTAPALVAAGDAGASQPAGLSSIARFSQVDDRLYRGAQPDEHGFAALRDLGVRTVISLRNDNAAERRVVEALGMSFVHLPVSMKPFGLSGEVPAAMIAGFFKVINDPASGVVFVHCRHGKDRTGLFVSLYRIARQGWKPDDAYREARRIGMSWWHFLSKGQIEAFASRWAVDGHDTGAPLPYPESVLDPRFEDGLRY